MSWAVLRASSTVVTAAPGGWGMPRRSIRSSKRARSSAMSIASALEPRMGWLARWRGVARLIAVWPPNWTIEGGPWPLAPSFSGRGGPGGVDGAVVDLDPLGDADGAAADDERLLAVQGGCLVLLVACA